MSLKDDVANFLLSDQQHITFAMSKLDFYLNDFHVDPVGYREIGHLIRQDAVSVEPASRSSGSSISAVYTAALNKLSLSPGMDLTGTTGTAINHQSTIIHEITHALMDFHHYQTSGTLQEVAAYISGGIYAASHHRQFSSSNPYSAAIIQAAFNVIRSHNLISNRGVLISRSHPDVEQLAIAIEAHPSYPNSGQPYRSDGISGGLINPWYQPRYL